MTKLTLIAAAVATVGLLGVSGVANAQSQKDVMIVRISDLNMSSPRGAEIALRRIKSAASAFCGPVSQEVGRARAQKSCVTRLTTTAVAKLDAPLVTALHKPHQPIQLAQASTAR